MTKDMVFDATPGIEDFGWKPRAFRPMFPSQGHCAEIRRS
jgi:hypothetical protein